MNAQALVHGLGEVIGQRRLPWRVQRRLDRLAVRCGIRERTARVDGLRVRFRRLTVDEIFVNKVLLERDYLPDRFSPSGTVVDVGANIGTFTLSVARSAGRVVSVEPERENFRLLSTNIALNRLSNVTLVRAAMAGENGSILLHATEGSGFHSIRSSTMDRADYQETQDVRAITLASLFAEHRVEQCELLKLDCEGAEHEILLTAPDAVLMRVRRIAMEYHVSDEPAQRRQQIDRLVTRLREVGLTIDQVQENEGKYAGCGMIFASRADRLG